MNRMPMNRMPSSGIPNSGRYAIRPPSVSRAAALRRLAAAGLLLASSACTPDRTAQSGATAASDGRVEVGLPAPAYATVNLNGDSVSLAAQRGKVVLLNVWATWCHPCRKEIPELRAIRERYQARGLELIGVSVDTDGTDDAIRGFMQEFSMDFPIWRDPDERVSTQFLVVGVPATFLIDKTGVLRWRKTGPIAPGDTALTAAIERALGGS
jgi:cytochrome c-type biogenesis protein